MDPLSGAWLERATLENVSWSSASLGGVAAYVPVSQEFVFS